MDLLRKTVMTKWLLSKKSDKLDKIYQDKCTILAYQLYLRLGLNIKFIDAAIDFMSDNFVLNTRFQNEMHKNFKECSVVPKKLYPDILSHMFMNLHN